MNFHDTFRKIVELTGRVGTLTYGIGAHFFNVTATSGSPVSAFCELRDHSTDRNTGVCKYTDDQIADVVKCLVIIGADDVRSKGKTLLEAENKLPERIVPRSTLMPLTRTSHSPIRLLQRFLRLQASSLKT